MPGLGGVGGSNCLTPKAERVSQVQQQLEMLCNVTEALFQTVGRVGDRLNQVLSSGAPEKLEKSTDARPTLVGIADAIFIQANKVASATAILNDMMDRCEL